MWDMANFIANALKENGLILPVNFTEEEFFEAGRCLAKIEHGMQWAIGDWYNSIPWGDKEAACKEAGLNFSSTKQWGVISERFPIGQRLYNLPFTHYQLLTNQTLTDSQRAELLEKSSKENWTVAQLRHERDQVLGRPEKVALPEFDERLESLLNELPAKVSTKAKGEVRKIYSDLKRDYTTIVEKEVNKRLQVERQRLIESRKEIEADREKLAIMARGITAVMTEDEYRLIRGLLHPDKHQDDPDRYNRAFEAFQRLEKTINPNIPVAILRKAGWDK